MAIEKHLLFAKREAALAQLNRAWDEYSTTAALGYGKSLAQKEAILLEALQRFRKVSDQIEP